MASVTVDNGGLTDYEVETYPSASGKQVQAMVPMGLGADYWPGYHGSDGALTEFTVDPDGALITRGSTTTDEGSIRVNFANSSFAVSVGSCTFANGSTAVTGTGFLTALNALNIGDYIKLDADGDSAWAQVDAITGDTTLTLVTAYGGTSGTGASSRAIVKPQPGTGGTMSVASGAATVAAGTTAAVQHTLGRAVDYGPLVAQAGLSVSQRIANQDIYIGGWDESATPRWFARFRLTGTTNTEVICQSGRNPTDAPSASEVESTTVTLPAGLTTASVLRYRVEMLLDKVRFFVNGVRVAEHYRVMPDPHDEMFCGVQVVNGTTPASGTSVVVDYMLTLNVNKLAVGLLSDTENVVVSQPPAEDYSYNVAGVIAINTVLQQIDCSQLRGLSIQCTSMGTTGVVTPEWSNDGLTWVAATLITQAGAAAATFNAAGMWTTPALARHFRLRLSTATTAGTTTLRLAGNAVPVGPAASQPVTGSVGVTSVVPGSAATSLGKLEDAVHASGDTGVAMLAVRTDTPATTSSATGDYDVLHTCSSGALQTCFIPTDRTGMSRARIVSAASTNSTLVKGSVGTLWGIRLYNNTSVKKFFKLYNKATAPTVGTDTPVETIIIPADGGLVLSVAADEFSLGIGYGITNGAADNDTTAVAANDVFGVLLYK